MRYKAVDRCLEAQPDHAKYAWISLFSVALTDLYIYLLAAGRLDDPRFF